MAQAETRLLVESVTTGEAPIQVEIVRTTISLPQFDPAQGELEEVNFSFSTYGLVQAYVLNYYYSYAFAGLETAVAVEFSAASGAPDFPTTLVTSTGSSPLAFVGLWGAGFPYTNPIGTSLLVASDEIQGAIGTETFDIDVAFTGLNSPTLAGEPVVASTPINQVTGTAVVYYSVAPTTLNNSANTASGSVGDDYVDLRAGDDNYSGGAGDDWIIGGAGRDTLDGGEGLDTASYSTADAGVSVYLAYDDRAVGGGMGRDTFISIENLRGSGFDDWLVGDSGDNVITGGAGNDTIKGKGGDDELNGGTGDDRLVSDSGADALYGGAGGDTLSALGGDDILSGGDGTDFAYGGQGNDEIWGGMGDDLLRGNRGSDTLEGDEGVDRLFGGGGDDDLDGGEGNDIVIGEGGSDTLTGGLGDDVLTGGFGGGVLDGVTDTFVFAPAAQNSGGFDRIKDFEDGIDLIDLSAFSLDDFAALLALSEERPSGLRIDFGAGDVLFIDGLSIDDFDASDVIL